MKFRKENNLSTIPYVYSVFRKEDDKYVEVPLIKAFPVVVGRIIEQIRALSDQLLFVGASQELINYLNSFADFFENDRAESYESLSKALDILWLRIDGRIIPTHPMEVYTDPGKFIVSPQLEVYFVDERYDDINKGIEKTRTNLIEFLKNRYKDLNSLEESVPLMLKAKASTYTTIVEAGESIIFRPFAANIPNWDEVRFNEGVRIVIMMNTAYTRWLGERESLIKIFGEDLVRKLYDSRIDDNSLFKYAAIVDVGGHEIAHNAFITTQTVDRITPLYFASLDETKASYAIFSAVDSIYDIEEQKIILLYILSFSLFKMNQLNESTVIAYVYMSLSLINLSFDTGIFKEENENYSINLDEDKIKNFWDKLKLQFDDLAKVYDSGTAIEADQFMKKYFVRSVEVEKLASKLS